MINSFTSFRNFLSINFSFLLISFVYHDLNFFLFYEKFLVLPEFKKILQLNVHISKRFYSLFHLFEQVTIVIIKSINYTL